MPSPAPYVNLTSQESGESHFFLHWTSGSSGAVGTVSRHAGFKSPYATHGATGVYVIGLAEPWAAGDLSVKGYVRQNSYSASGACQVVLTAVDVGNLTTPTFTVLITNAAGAAVEPTTSDFIVIEANLQLQPNNAG